MRHARWTIVGSTGLAFLIAAWGCESGDKPAAAKGGAAAEAKVSGKVTVKGKAVTRGKVTFEPPQELFPAVTERVAEIRKDGTYEVTAAVGTNSVMVSGTGNPEAGNSYFKKKVEVQAGENTADLDLPFEDK